MEVEMHDATEARAPDDVTLGDDSVQRHLEVQDLLEKAVMEDVALNDNVVVEPEAEVATMEDVALVDAVVQQPGALETVVTDDVVLERGVQQPAGIRLSWSGLRYTIIDGGDPRDLLDGLQGEVNPGEICAILGSSGAGKTTMLNVLAGRIASGDVSGKVLANGKPRDPQRWRRIASFVEQDDVLFQNLTVRETLLYAAQLRLPSTMAQSEKEARVDAIIEGLGLSACAKTYIGSADKRGISGGERKRVCIGCELVTDPDLLFLDEPTSGLDAFTASSVVETLRALAKAQRKTILTTIHQPRTEILYMFDRVILLALGRCVFSGSIQEGVEYFAAQGFPCPPLTNPSDHFIDTITVDFRSPERRISSLERICTLHDAWVAATAHDVAKVFETADDEPEADALQPANYCNSFAKELGILTRRAMLNVSRDLASIKAIVLKTCIFIVLFGALYFRMPNDAAGGINRIGLLFLVAVHTTMTTMIPIISSFPPIKTIIKRELASGAYRSWSGFLAQTIASLVLPISSTFLFALTVYWIVGLQATLAKYATFVLFLCVHSAVACMIGVSISGVAPNAFVGQIAGSIFVLISLIFGGQVVDLPSVTPYVRWIKWLSTVHYAYVGISQNEFNGLKIDCQRSSKQLCLPEGEMVIEEFSLNDVSLYWNLPANIALGTGALLIGAIAFHYKTRPVMKLSSTPEPEIVLESVSE